MSSFSRLQEERRGGKSPIPDKYPLFDLLRKKSKSERGKHPEGNRAFYRGSGIAPPSFPPLTLEIASARA